MLWARRVNNSAAPEQMVSQARRALSNRSAAGPDQAVAECERMAAKGWQRSIAADRRSPAE
jgi:hypothetical protein